MGVNLDGLDMSKGNFILTYDSAFTCADNVFIEYHDIMRCIQFTIINFLRKNSIFKGLLDTSEIEDMSEAELYVWYISRIDVSIVEAYDIGISHIVEIAVNYMTGEEDGEESINELRKILKLVNDNKELFKSVIRLYSLLNTKNYSNPLLH